MQGGYPGYQPTPSSALAIASLILGIIGLLSGWLIFGGVLGLVGVILGIVALVKVKNGTASGKGMAIGGIVHRCAGHDWGCCHADSGPDWPWHAQRVC